MKKVLIFIAVITVLALVALQAEITIKLPPVEDEEREDYTPPPLKTTPKSLPLAVLMSAALPGTGQLYLGQKNKVGPFLATDMLSFFALYKFNQERSIAIHNYKSYAQANAGIRKGATTDIYTYASRYKSAHEYNLAMELFYKNYLVIDYITQEQYYEWVERDKIGEEDWWDWQYDSQFQQYKRIRYNKQEFEQYANLAVGALIINRMISVIDAAISTNKINTANRTVYAVPDLDGKGISLNYEFRF